MQEHITKYNTDAQIQQHNATCNNIAQHVIILGNM